MERLLRCRLAPSEPSDENTPPPAGLCTAIASAPRSVSWRTHVGPARARVRSTTRMPASGPSTVTGRRAAARASRRAVSGMNRASARRTIAPDDGVRAVERRHPADARTAADGLERHLGVVVAQRQSRTQLVGEAGVAVGRRFERRRPPRSWSGVRGSAGSRPRRRARARPRGRGWSRATDPTPTRSTRRPRGPTPRRSMRRPPSSSPRGSGSHRQRRDARDHHDEAEHQEPDGAADRRLRELTASPTAWPASAPGSRGGRVRPCAPTMRSASRAPADSA